MEIMEHNDGILEINVPTEKDNKTITTTQEDLEKVAQALTESLDNEIEITTSNLWHYSPFVHTQLSNGEKLITYRIEDEPKTQPHSQSNQNTKPPQPNGTSTSAKKPPENSSRSLLRTQQTTNNPS